MQACAAGYAFNLCIYSETALNQLNGHWPKCHQASYTSYA
jgi:hypothetical protein